MPGNFVSLQCQENGSYRSDAMRVALQETLPAVVTHDEPAVVCLDWYAGHKAPEIASLAADSGLVLFMHGGGTTGYAQVNDTHLHARLSSALSGYEPTD